MQMWYTSTFFSPQLFSDEVCGHKKIANFKVKFFTQVMDSVLQVTNISNDFLHHYHLLQKKTH